MKCSLPDCIILFFLFLAVLANIGPQKPKQFRHGVAWDYTRRYGGDNRVGYFDDHQLAKRGSNPGQR